MFKDNRSYIFKNAEYINIIKERLSKLPDKKSSKRKLNTGGVLTKLGL